jgi:adenosylmethionine-8-amino-7-oxononanoate aminotransferase
VNDTSYRVWSTWSPITRLLHEYDASFDVQFGRGSYLFTRNGRRILDAAAGLWTVNLGHGREDVIAAIAGQLSRTSYLHVGSTMIRSDLGHQYAERLLGHAPSHFSRLMFHCTGTAAIEASQLILRRWFRESGQPQRWRTIALEGGYHGASMLTFSMAGHEDYVEKNYGPRVPGCHHIPLPADPEGEESYASLVRLLETHGPESFAAFVFEPVLGSSGTIPLPEPWLKRVLALCREHGIKTVADEVVTGLGRTGRWFASEALDVDVLVLGKGVAAGYYPVTASVWREDIFDLFARGAGIALDTGCTMDAHPAGCAAALAVLSAIERESLIERARESGARMALILEPLKNLPIVRAVRCAGLMAGIALQGPSGSAISFQRVERIHRSLMREGLLTIVSWDALSVAPPLNVEASELSELGEILKSVLEKESMD